LPFPLLVLHSSFGSPGPGPEAVVLGVLDVPVVLCPSSCHNNVRPASLFAIPHFAFCILHLVVSQVLLLALNEGQTIEFERSAADGRPLELIPGGSEIKTTSDTFRKTGAQTIQ
jgi:hypothetical protein